MSIMKTVKEKLEEYRDERTEKVSADHLEDLIEEATGNASTARLEAIWRTAYLLTFPGSFVKSWSAREQGQIGMMRKELGESLFPALLAEVVKTWAGFRTFLKDERGHGDVTTRPHVGLLHYHRDAALEYLERVSANTGESGFGKKL